MNETTPIFVIHVKSAIDREEHINSQFKRFGLNHDFITDGDMSDIDQNILDKYFSGDMKRITPQTSCALKHLYSYKHMIDHNIPEALIFEDDIILKPNFIEIFQQIKQECSKENISNYIVSLENSGHNYINKSEQINGKILYKKDSIRCAGAYYIDLAFAKTVLEHTLTSPISLPIDWYIQAVAKEKGGNIFWSHPFVAEQGSHNGKMRSLIDKKGYGFFRTLVYSIQKHLKSRKKEKN
jgi:glycosyl transferase family 25